MKKFETAVAALLAIALTAAALEVNEPEIESVGGQTVQFENYTGPHTVIDTRAAIKGIGTRLGNDVAANVNETGFYRRNEKYSVIHAVDTEETGKLDADILIINASATVDHIRNLRWIIGAYLTAAYGYSDEDASTVATFVTVYNAVYRGQLDVYRAKYKTVVTQNLTEEKCGLSTKWSDWPGNSQIVIPLSDLSGGLSTVDTSTISEKDVIESLRENEDDKGIDDRKQMVDIKERESETAGEKAQEAQAKADEEKQKLADQQQQQEAAQQQADQAKKDAQNDRSNAQKKEAAENAQKESEQKKEEAENAQKDSEQKKEEAENAQKESAQKKEEAENAQKDADKKQQEANQAENKVIEEQKKTDEQQAKADDAQKKADEQQAKADQKQAEAQAERAEIAKDQQKLLEESLSESENKNAVIALAVSDNAAQLSQMVKVDSSTGALIRESPVTVVRGRTLLPAGTIADIADELKANGSLNSQTKAMLDSKQPIPLYMAVCGESNAKNSTQDVRLCLLDSFRMEIQKTGEESVAPDSVLVQKAGDYYCVIKDGGKWVVGKYDAKLKLRLKSPVEVVSSTSITIVEQGVIVTAGDGSVVLLKLSDLTQITKGTSGKRRNASVTGSATGK